MIDKPESVNLVNPPITIIRSNNIKEDARASESIEGEEEVSTSNNEDIPVFGDELEVPTYLRNRGSE